MGYILDNLLYFECRLRRLIKVSGHTIFSESVEEVIRSLPYVKDTYVVPVSHKTRGQGVFAYVILKDGNNELEHDKLAEEIKKKCALNLVAYAIPVHIEFCSNKEIPKTSLDKIIWGKLEERANELYNN